MRSVKHVVYPVARSLLVFAAFVLVAPGYGQRVARMQLPTDLAARTERFEAGGFGGANRGQYQLADFSGEFTRFESRLGIFDPLLVRNRGKSSFTLRGPDFEEPLAADCEMKEGVVTIRAVTFNPKKMTYQCTYSMGGRLFNGRLVLGELKPKSMRARLMAAAERQGEAVIDGVSVWIRSVHHYEGSKLKSATPVGYLLTVDEVLVGAVELTDVNPTVFLPAEPSLELRKPVLATALALAVLRDPAESALGD